MKRIAITINLKKSIWANGINQNAIYLANLLKEIGYNVYLVHGLNENVEDINGIKTISFKKAYDIPFAMVIQLGLTVSNNMLSNFRLKNKNVKLVAYECGNKYIIDMEAILFKKNNDTVISDTAKPHQIWSIPQMENTNLQYYSFSTSQDKATVVPFIWEPIAIEDYCNDYGYSTYTNREINRVGVMEPNISVMKNVLLPIAVLEKQYKKHSNLKEIYLIGADLVKSSKRLIQILSETKIYKDGLVSADSRIPSMDAINKYFDLVLSWQWENNLNYLWLDIAWMGWPVVHNGSMCQDVGYYYEGFDIQGGQEAVQKAIESHNDDAEYLERNRTIIKRYTHQNEKLKEQYKMLVENVLNNKFEKYSYDWKTNSIL